MPDLMDRSRLSSIPGIVFARSPEELAETATGSDVVFLDASRPGVLEVAEAIKAKRIVAFASHVDEELMEEARRRGCDEVLARSVFFRRANRLSAGA